jgi:hypothetical protein
MNKTDKMIGEEDLKGLEEEIENAVDRLFVEKKEGGTESFLMESPAPEPPSKSSKEEPSIIPSTLKPSMGSPILEPAIESLVLEPAIESLVLEPSMKHHTLESPLETSLLESSHDFESAKNINFESSPPIPPVPIPFLKSIEKLEADLLALEWEITGEKINKTREEVLALRELLKQRGDMILILSYMEKTLNLMIGNEENIQPSWIKFLLDSKDTIKLLMRKEKEGEIDIYKQLACLGIEARFSCLEGMKEVSLPPFPHIQSEEREKTEIPIVIGEKIEEAIIKLNSFSKKMDEITQKIEPYFSKIEQLALKLSEIFTEGGPPPVNITVFKVDDRLLGVESEKVFKLYKVPNNFQEKFMNLPKIRLKDFEVKMINLKKLLSIQGGEPKGEKKILMVKGNGEYKGFMIDQVLKKLSTTSDKEGESGEYFSGIIHSTYKEQSVEIPILDLKKF